MSGWYRSWGKRGVDLTLTIVAAPLVVPIALLVALCVRVDLGRPVIFRQRRIGYGARPFTVLKFRTMRDTVGSDGALAPDGERLTRFGTFLRRTSLDELPELINVLRGEMSLVGPRPLLPEYLERYSARQARRHEVRPGLTGLAQIRGRNETSWEDRLESDVEYVERVGPLTDLRVLAVTVPLVLFSRGVSARGHATMPEFRGDGSDQPR